jgi:hypothetical protein
MSMLLTMALAQATVKPMPMMVCLWALVVAERRRTSMSMGCL